MINSSRGEGRALVAVHRASRARQGQIQLSRNIGKLLKTYLWVALAMLVLMQNVEAASNNFTQPASYNRAINLESSRGLERLGGADCDETIAESPVRYHFHSYA
ncbi:hypothetical protein RRG08_025004 [Elysia crispata]|uniref:Uncharacterized protein n=1 Tax=Elysia crispata TaxID=231223 RepID=A0AAE1ANV5_9GAST|nr:hypothetical protein RRG08_025004 [Elysia crispata]